MPILLLMGTQILGRIKPLDGAAFNLKPRSTFPDPDDPSQPQRHLAVGRRETAPQAAEGFSSKPTVAEISRKIDHVKECAMIRDYLATYDFNLPLERTPLDWSGVGLSRHPDSARAGGLLSTSKGRAMARTAPITILK
jgi:hypothetical protein